jgi:hypothetical protein
VRGALEVDEPIGERWNLAVELLANSESAVSIGILNLYRDASGPRADGRLHVEIRATYERWSMTMASAQRDVESGLRQLDDLLSDTRFAAIASRHGVTTEYVSDYDTGRVTLADVGADWSITWHANSMPHE